MYPENWKVTEDIDNGKLMGFSIESPCSAFLSVTEYPWTVTPIEALDQSYQVLQADYDDVEFESIDAQLKWEEEPLPECVSADVRFYYLDLMVVSRLIAFVLNGRTFLVQIQAEDRDFDQLDMVFRAIIVSMLQSVKSE